MGNRIRPQLKAVVNNRPITEETDREFLNHLRMGLLLALKEQGILNEVQFRYAGEALRRRCL